MQKPAPFTPAERAAIERVFVERKSVRAFSGEPVARETVEHILDVAARAPSGTNMQPWRAHVVTGAVKDRLSATILAALKETGGARAEAEYKYYPDQFFEPYLTRRRKVGFDMYGLLGIERGDKAAMMAQGAQNYLFFGAPIGIIFTIDRKLEIGSWLDFGYFLQAVSIAARANGLETCSQAAFAAFHKTVRAELALDASEIVVCGMSLGRADWSAKVNALETTRASARDFATFRGFE
ncbi:MAG: nitroreductase [Hyphomicrobiales bacterium]|nr:nitroreductase [Hyphomicrobiales bacterium]